MVLPWATMVSPWTVWPCRMTSPWTFVTRHTCHCHELWWYIMAINTMNLHGCLPWHYHAIHDELSWHCHGVPLKFHGKPWHNHDGLSCWNAPRMSYHFDVDFDDIDMDRSVAHRNCAMATFRHDAMGQSRGGHAMVHLMALHHEACRETPWMARRDKAMAFPWRAIMAWLWRLPLVITMMAFHEEPWRIPSRTCHENVKLSMLCTSYLRRRRAHKPST